METIKSGIYARCGTENKDMITEATAQEFRDWMREKGLNIDFMSDNSLNGESPRGKEPLFQWRLRLAFIQDAENMGIIVYRAKDDWNAFKEKFREEAERHHG